MVVHVLKSFPTFPLISRLPRLLAVLLSLALTLAAFAQGPVAPAPAAGGAVPGAPFIPVRNENYVLRAGDNVEVRVFREDNLTTRAQVSQDGSITFPLLGQVKVIGKSLSEAQHEIARLLDRDYIVNPQVSVTLVSYAAKRFTVIGKVRSPGIYNLPGEDTIGVVEAIGMAGGFGGSANENKVVLARVENGKETVYILNVRDMSRGKIKRFEVHPGDVITVKETFF